MSAADGAGVRRGLFVTGRLAEPALRRVLAENPLPVHADVRVLNITVAALMTTDWIARHLTPPLDADFILVPGLCEGDPRVIADATGVPVERGPKDLRDIPRYFGRQPADEGYGAWTIEIVAEINHAARLTTSALRAEAAELRAAGADVIDVGCTPGQPFPHLAQAVGCLVGDGLRVSVDSFDPRDIVAAVEAGAELVLSLNGSNVAVAPDLAGSGARVVVVPDAGGGIDSMLPTMERLTAHAVPFLLDPVLEPIGHGFMASLERYAALRRRFPDAAMLMGVGNLTELTAADSTGVNALLVAICEELAIGTVLTTQVASWARGAVREIDVARRLMHHAVTRRTLPKGIDDRLLTVKDAAVLTYSEDELRALQANVTDPNFRIFADREAITVFNNRLFVRGTEIQAMFAALAVDDPAHAFYLGKELARAQLAVQLGKTYRQEGALAWGYLTPPDDPRGEHQPAARRMRRRGAADGA